MCWIKCNIFTGILIAIEWSAAMYRTTVVFPCYNEAKRMDPSVFIGYLSTNPDTRFVFVNDCSTDNTLSVIQNISERSPDGSVTYMSLEKNSGKAEAVRQGMLEAMQADSKCIGFLDADLSTPLSEIEKLSEPILSKKASIVFGARVAMLGHDIERRALRHYMGRVFATFASHALDLKIYDTQCGAKFFSSCNSLRDLFEEPFMTNWTFDVELIARLKKAGMFNSSAFPQCAIEVPLDKWTHMDGSKVSPIDFFVSLYDLWRIKRKYLS